MAARRFVRDALLVFVALATLAIGCAAAASAKGEEEAIREAVATEVAESFPEPAPAPGAGGLVTQPPATDWDIVVGSPCSDPYACDPLP